MNVKPHLGPDHPLIKAAFSCVFKSSAKIFFRVNPDGTHQKIAAYRALDNVPISIENKWQLVASYPFEHQAYSSERMKRKAAALANRQRKPVRVEAAVADPNEVNGDEDEEAETDGAFGTSKKNPEFFLVSQSNGYFGAFSAREGNVVAMFKTEREATAYIRELLQGGSHLRSFYGSKVKAD